MIEDKINQIVLWGHKLHSHTHSYIHFGFKKAFEYLGYRTMWLDNNDNVDNVNFSNSLFITEGSVDEKIPIRDDCYYIIHNCNFEKYKNLNRDNILMIQVYTKDVFKYNLKKIDDYIYFGDKCLYMPWATDLLPFEIDDNITKLNTFSHNNIIYLIGMPIYPWDEVARYCNNNNLKYVQLGGFSQNNISSEENMRLIQNSYIAPAVQCQWQVDNGYIPCRIFKNISYGKMGMTNNLTVYELFDKHINYNPNTEELMNMGVNFENKTQEEKNSLLIPLMLFVRDKHTYLNRINMIFRYFNDDLN
jgi:hypothetical protein